MDAGSFRDELVIRGCLTAALPPPVFGGFTIPTAELRDLHFVAGCGLEVSSEIACKPTRLQFELGRKAAWRE
jgi:hypothetical protein